MDTPSLEGSTASATRAMPPPAVAPPVTPAVRARACRRKRVHIAIVVAFGALVPAFLIGLAVYGLWDLQRDFGPGGESVVHTIAGVQKVVTDSKDVNAYALASFVFAEHSNYGVVHDKQRMKIVVMQIGFAVSSIGIMFILLGVNDGGAEVTAETAGTKIDLKTASTGLVAFLIGAGMAYGAGIIPNEYSTVGVPTYGTGGEADDSADTALRAFLVQVVKTCSADPEQTQGACFVQSLARPGALGDEKAAP
ncbi:hypothetical protein [Paraburkholderia humisilvae]|uniref:Uncharacterized protein n=1 Tax=Paraburkholderia humisilvae TaxID=627669 RepID=A0A6J5DDS1_9BURK|nr:hypothetical protein [Paraburkholderia humisilvae]CAB3752410.1 hypothetical protein LMG29542_01735 [Paraburkholderia humisilvae]